MELQIKGTRYEPTEKILSQARRQILPLARFIDERQTAAFAQLELDRAVGGKRSGDVWRAELMIDHGGVRFRAESTKAKLDHALTTVSRDVARELRRAGKRDQDMLRRGSSKLKDLLRGFGAR